MMFFKDNPVDKKKISLIIRKGKAYIPTLAKTEWGVYMTMEPVYTVDLDDNALINSIKQLLKSGNTQVSNPSKEDLNHQPDPVLKAAKVNSWKKLSVGGATYTISQQPEGFTLEFYKKDEKGRFITDTSKTREFPPETNLREIVRIVLEDIYSHPELLS